jgi:hypothetical protein
MATLDEHSGSYRIFTYDVPGQIAAKNANQV